jgi:hypothetical protein
METRQKKYSSLVHLLRRLTNDPFTFIQEGSKLTLRQYQTQVVRAVYESVKNKAGETFVVLFPRQSGKNELQAQLETFLLVVYSLSQAEMVKVSPTWKPQTLNAMRRLERVLDINSLTRSQYLKESGYIYRVGTARIQFFSGQPRSNIVGATASLLLEVDEAQDISLVKYDKEIAPMCASTNATRVLWGTAWTSRTLLARELRNAQEKEKMDGIKRTFVLNAEDVSREVPEYGKFVAEQVARLGRNHPMVKTQYFSEEIDAEGGLFPPERMALMRGNHPFSNVPRENCTYCMTLDIAGEDETPTTDPETGEVEQFSNPRRDSTALTVFEVDMSTIDDPIIHKPTYRVVFRREWVGVKHSTLYAQILSMAETFHVRWLVADATGVGAGLTSFLCACLGEKVIPFDFNSRTKSDLCWNFIGIIESGRFKDHRSELHEQRVEILAAPQPPAAEGKGKQPAGYKEQTEFWRQISFCEFEILPGPQKTVRWGVPDGMRDPANGEMVHDDLLISAALVATLDDRDWSAAGPSLVVRAKDPLDELDQGF